MTQQAARPGDVEGSDELVARVAPVGVLIGGLVFVDQITQVASVMPAFTPGSAEWRFQAAILTASRIPYFALGSIAIAVAAGKAELPRARRAGMVLLAVSGVFLVAAVFSLWLDGPVVRDLLPPPELSGFEGRWLRASALATLSLVVGMGVWYGAIANRKGEGERLGPSPR